MLTGSDLMDVIKTCGESGVSEIRFENGSSVYIRFGVKQKEIQKSYQPIYQTEDGQLPPKNDTIAVELSKQDDLDDLLITDPEEYEKQLMFDKNTQPGQ